MKWDHGETTTVGGEEARGCFECRGSLSCLVDLRENVFACFLLLCF